MADLPDVFNHGNKVSVFSNLPSVLPHIVPTPIQFVRVGLAVVPDALKPHTFNGNVKHLLCLPFHLIPISAGDIPPRHGLSVNKCTL